jgi:hypothetical protein
MGVDAKKKTGAGQEGGGDQGMMFRLRLSPRSEVYEKNSIYAGPDLFLRTRF